MLMSAAGDMFWRCSMEPRYFRRIREAEPIGHLSEWLNQAEITVYSSVPSVFRNFANTLRGDETFPSCA